MGSLHRLGVPNKEGKWTEFGWFLCKNYFDFPVGARYIITRDIVKHLSHNSDRLMHYNNEDTSLDLGLLLLDIHLYTILELQY